MRRNRNSKRELGRRRGLASAAAWKPSEPDADTLRMRALWDAKGKVKRFGVTYTATGERPWVMRRSVSGRINQVDLVIDDSLWRTGSERAANSAIKYGKWPCY